MPGCKDVGLVLQAGAPTPGEEGFCDRLGNKTRGARHWGQLPGQCGGSFGPLGASHLLARKRAEKDGISYTIAVPFTW